jgi:branched-chain amino acid transport system substrate-binding protein
MRIISALLISIFLLSLSACSSFFCPGKETQEVQIGVLLPLTGKNALIGQKTRAGILCALNQINSKGLAGGEKIKLLIIDNKTSFKTSGRATKRFTKNKKIKLLIAICSTENALAVKEVAHKNKLPVLFAIATGNIVTERSPYMFRCCFNDDSQAKAMALFAHKNKLYDDVGILLDLNDQITYRRDLGRAFAKAFKKWSKKTIREVAYQSGTDNFILQMRRFKQYNTKAIFAPCDIPDAGLMLTQARLCGLDKVFLGSDGWDQIELFNYCGPNPRPCFLSSMFSPNSELPGVKEFVKSMKARTGSIPNAYTAQAFDALQIAAKALELSQSSSNIRSGLYKIKDYPGVTGNISIDAQGNAQKNVFIKEVIKKADGKFDFKLIKTISPNEIK